MPNVHWSMPNVQIMIVSPLLLTLNLFKLPSSHWSRRGHLTFSLYSHWLIPGPLFLLWNSQALVYAKCAMVYAKYVGLKKVSTSPPPI